ncbi:MAG: hypothetical protein WBL99_07770 [Candidatus Acidiferrales bacterium]
MRKHTVAAIFFLVSTVCLGQAKSQQNGVSVARLGNVLDCLQSKASSFGYPPPRFDARSFRVRYVYGKQSPTDEADELHVVVYAAREESATLFEVYLQTKADKQEIFIGDAATLKKQKGRMVIDEIPGGLATARRIEKLIETISHQRAITVMDRDVKPDATACVYQP